MPAAEVAGTVAMSGKAASAAEATDMPPARMDSAEAAEQTPKEAVEC